MYLVYSYGKFMRNSYAKFKFKDESSTRYEN